MKTRLTLSQLPPSVNAIWRHGKNRTYRTRDYMTWQGRVDR